MQIPEFLAGAVGATAIAIGALIWPHSWMGRRWFWRGRRWIE